MEDYEKFKLNMSNIFMLLITGVLVAILVLVSLMLYKSIKKPTGGLPQLNITHGRGTTKSTLASTYTTATTTSKKINTESPYYDLDVDSLLKDDIYSKRELTREEAFQVGNDILGVIHKLYDITDYTLFDTEAVVTGAKEGELDKFVNKDITYAQLYNLDKFLEKFYVKQSRKDLFNLKINNSNAFIHDNDRYYRMTNTKWSNLLEFVMAPRLVFTLHTSSAKSIFPIVEYLYKPFLSYWIGKIHIFISHGIFYFHLSLQIQTFKQIKQFFFEVSVMGKAFCYCINSLSYYGLCPCRVGQVLIPCT